MPKKTNTFLRDYQEDAVKKMHNGCILNGGVGSGKSRTGLYYYFKEQGGSYDGKKYVRMKNPKDLYIITTAMKRDSLEWEVELANYCISTNPKATLYKKLQVTIDSWNNIKKYADIKDEEALKREFAVALNPETEEEKSDNVRTKFQIGLKDVLVEETVQVLDHVLPWEDAIQTVAKPLLDRGDITERYVQKAIDNIKVDKPFIMIADGVIIAHAGVDDGAKRVCLSLLTMPERTDVYGYMEADVVIMIGTPDPTKHLEVLEQLNHIIEDKKSLQLLRKAKKPEDIIKLIQKRKKEKKKC